MRWLWVLLFSVGAMGCGAQGAEFGRRASALNMNAELVRGDPFDHMVFMGASQSRSRRLHVYLDGDGTPWVGGRPARDPTPRNTLVLSLMALDNVDSVYLGRPCYHGLADAPGCTAELWTSARYSEAIVRSMTVALRQLVASRGAGEIIWFGYSGGGTLAVLLAPRFPESIGIVTVAANLDIDAWTDTHRDLRLTGSLNPRRQPPIPDRIVQVHYVGGRDRVVSAEVVRSGMTGAGQIVVVPKYDHVCCWETAWPGILEDIERATRAVAR